ncbi:MAG: hypothetical protein JSU07_06505 [Bacteroidetes bacterium]|nr:hypothetical protein [Bacteroidota bacterium]
MSNDDFLNPNPINPKDLFDNEKYNTIILNTNNNISITDQIDTLTNNDIPFEVRDQILHNLKQKNCIKELISAIESSANEIDKSKIIAACWESGLDFSEHLLFFTTLALSKNIQISIEAITVIENCENNISNTIITQALSIANSTNNMNAELKNDLLKALNNLLKL